MLHGLALSAVGAAGYDNHAQALEGCPDHRPRRRYVTVYSDALPDVQGARNTRNDTTPGEVQADVQRASVASQV